MEPKINQYLYMQVESADEVESQQEYKARIADIQADTIGIEIPINDKTGKLKRLFTGDYIYAYYVSEGGMKNFFNSSVLGVKEDTIKLVVIQKPDPATITKVQRRNYLRVPAELEISVQLSDHVQLLGTTVDLGGGGVSFICDAVHPIEVKDVVSCWLLLEFRNTAIDHVSFTCEVIRVKKLETGKQLAMASITEIHNVDRQKIIKYCFERQLELRK